MSSDSTIPPSSDPANFTHVSSPETAPQVRTEGSHQRGPHGQSGIDHDLVNQTKQQIRTLIQEIAELAKSDCSAEDFYEGFLTRTSSALASVGGAIWSKDSTDGPLKLQYQINLKQTGLIDDPVAQTQHSLLLNKLLETSEPILIGPHSGLGDSSLEPVESSAADVNQPGNPTECLLLVGPLVIDRECVGLVEIFQRAGAGPTTQRGYLRFLLQMCEIASDFLRNQRLRLYSEQQSMWQQLEQFIQGVHRGLETDQTVYTIANEGRRLINCDRVSVAIRQGHRCKVQSVSGLDSIERRSDQIKKLGGLASRVIRAGEAVWYSEDSDDLPPQIESRLHDYVDRSHTKMLAIIPLREALNPDESVDVAETRLGNPIGALIVEQLKDSEVTADFRKRVEVVVAHSQIALTNSVSHNGIFLMPVWKSLGHLTSAFRGSRLVKTAMIVATLFTITAFLCLFPYSFSLGANGQLAPQVQHEVFAQIDGTLKEILVPENAETVVEKGAILARMTNNDLLVEIENMEGKLRELREQKTTLEQARNSVTDIDELDRIMLEGDLIDVQQSVLNLEDELKLKKQQLAHLEIRAPSRGQVVNWQVRQNLLRRPVSRGQNLMTIIDPGVDWQLELELPERRVSHLIEAQSKSNKPINVEFTLVSHPGQQFIGTIHSIDKQLAVHSEDGNSVLLRVSFDNQQVPAELLRAGTRIRAQIQCGTRSIGYVYFHELFETVQSSFMLWF